MIDCPSCTLQFETERAMKIHHAQTHSISLTEYQEDTEWIIEELEELEITDIPLDRMVKHLNERIILQRRKHNLNN